MIADKVAISTSQGIEAVALALINVIRPEALLAQTSLADTRVAAERLRDQLRDKNPNLDYRITVGPKGPDGRLTTPIATCSTGELRIDVLARDPEAYRKNPISFQVRMTKDAWDRFQAGLREGDSVTLGPEDIKEVSSGLFEVAGFPLGALTNVQSFSINTPEHLLAGKLHLRLMFRQGSDEEQFPYVEFEKTKVGSDLFEIRSCAPPLPIKLILGLRQACPAGSISHSSLLDTTSGRSDRHFGLFVLSEMADLLNYMISNNHKRLGTLRCNAC